MNIIYFTQIFYPLIYGGGEYIFYQWAKELIKRGHKVTVITQAIDGANSYEVKEGIEIFRVGLKIKYNGELPPTIFDNLQFFIFSIIKFVHLQKKIKFDIIHSNTFIPAFSGQISACISHRPHVITVHDIYFTVWKQWSQQEGVSRLSQYFGPILERMLFVLPVTVIHTVSMTTKKDIENLNLTKKKIVVIPNGIIPSEYKTQNNKIKKLQAIFIGRLIFYKNLQTVIKAFYKIIPQFPTSKLIIVGDGPYKKYLETLSKNLKNNIIFLGRQSDEEKIRLLNESSFLINPSTVEGFGIVILEAYACKKPVLVSNVYPFPEIVDDNLTGILVEPFDDLKWEEKITYLFDHFGEISQMGENGYNKLQNFYTINKIVYDLEKLYKDICK